MTGMTPTMQRLRRLPLFAHCGRRELAVVADRTTTVHARRGEILLREGSSGREVFVIIEGSVRVVRDGEPVATLGPGDVCGEVALLDDGPRTATVVADSDLVIEVSSAREFTELLHVVPSMRVVLLRQLARRLRGAMDAPRPTELDHW